MKLRQASAAALLAGLLALGCSGGSNSPTSSSGFQIVIVAALANAAVVPTIIEARLLFDGAEVEDPGTESNPVATILFAPTGFATTGPHTFALQIVSQTTSPNTYIVPPPVIRVFDVAGTPLKTIQLNAQTASLATGGTITYSFSL
ncbi:MAG TPA: hypothetical protein VHB47_22290 [Thermoanaerobaculia bacterium]|jgi:hypothetical protein|nr:hypothetical protein [Thermoanaerobaculia bacterium]